MADDRDAARKGKAVEHLVASTCILASGLRLNVSTSLVDDEGVDLVFHRRQRSTKLAVQVKERAVTGAGMKRDRFRADVRSATLRPRTDLYMLFVAVDAREGHSRTGGSSRAWSSARSSELRTARVDSCSRRRRRNRRRIDGAHT